MAPKTHTIRGMKLKETFDTINWDDFWQRKLEASFRERTQAALDDFVVVAVDHRIYAEKLISLLQDKYPDAEFAADNCFGSWGIYARTKGRRKLSEKKLSSLQEDAEEVYEDLLQALPLSTLPQERRSKSENGCIPLVLLLSLSAVFGAIVMLG
jgi:hypothetical protein